MGCLLAARSHQEGMGEEEEGGENSLFFKTKRQELQ